MIKLGSTSIGSVYKGSTALSKAYLGSTLVLQPANLASYAVLKKTSSQALAASGNRTATWDAVHIGRDDVWSSDDNTKITIPNDWDGHFGVLTFTARVESANLEHHMAIFKNGSSFIGVPRGSTVTTDGTIFRVCIETPLHQFTAGDYYEAVIWPDDASTLVTNWTSFGIHRVYETQPSSAFVYKQTTSQSGTSGAITFNTEVYDTGGFHSTASNTDQFVIPSGVSLIKARAGCEITEVNTQTLLNILKGGVDLIGGGVIDTDFSGERYHNIASAPIAVSAGDIITTSFFGSTSVTVAAGNNTWFQIEAMPADTKYALLTKSAATNIGNSTWTTVTWETETVDTDGFHSSSNSSRLTVPAGVTAVKLTANVNASSDTSEAALRIIKNGSSTPEVGLGEYSNQTAGSEFLRVFTNVLEVVEGDYFEVQAWRTGATGTTVASGANASFSIEVIA